MPDEVLTELSIAVGRELKSRGLLLVTAESCTGGWVGQEITAIAGSSDYYDRGFITYSNTAKRELLGVTEGTLNRFGAVSEETARAMASGALGHSPAHVALSITGVAGPGGGSPDKPVGTVCFGWAVKGRGEAQSARRVFPGDREAVRRQAVQFALEGVLERLKACTSLG